MKRTIALLAAALLGAGLAPVSAQAASCVGQKPQSLFGTIESVHPGYFTLRTDSAAGQINVNTQDAHMVYDGMSLNPGVYAGVYGCTMPADRSFLAETVTLASNAQSYPTRWRYTSSDKFVDGSVLEARSGEILIHNPTGHGDVWVMTNKTGFTPGQYIHADGYFIEGDRGFIASNIAMTQNMNQNGATTVEGQVREVHPGRVLVHANAGHGYVWVLTNAGNLRPGQTILATGHFDPQREFVATNVQIQ